MSVLGRDRVRLIGWMVGLLVVVVIAGGGIGYGVGAQRAREAFDDTLWLRADEVFRVVLREDGSVDTNALQYGADLNSLGMEVYLFDPAGVLLFGPGGGRRLAGLPAVFPLQEVVKDGSSDLRTVTVDGQRVRVLTQATGQGEDEAYHTVLIAQIGRAESVLEADVARLRWTVLGLGGVLIPLAVGVGLVLARQAMVPVRRSLAQQQAFVANAAHELRTPLSVIQATAELALLRPREAEEYAAALRQVAGAAEETTALVEDLLTLARLDAGRDPVPRAPVELGALVREVLAEAEGRYPQARLRAIIVPESVIAANAALVRRLLSNLVENACRYTPSGTAIQVTTTVERSWVVVRVQDEGNGIPPDEVEQVFARFYRGSAGRGSGHRGAGLGLSLVQQITETHGGRVGLATAVGRGTTVTVWLPKGTLEGA